MSPRPAAIVWFERTYLAGFALRIVLAVLNWATANAAATQIGVMIGLLLWYGVMYQRSQVCRWLLVVILVSIIPLTGLRIAANAYDLVSDIIAVAIMALNAAAVAYLFNAWAWFEKPE